MSPSRRAGTEHPSGLFFLRDLAAKQNIFLLRAVVRLPTYPAGFRGEHERTFRAAVSVPSTSKRAMIRGFLAGMVVERERGARGLC